MSNLRIFLKFDVYRKYIDINYACEYIFFNMQIPENPKSIQATCVDLPHVYIGVRPRYISRVGFPQCASSSSATCIRQYSHQGFPGMARLLYLLIIASFPAVFASVTEMTDKIVKVLCF